MGDAAFIPVGGRVDAAQGSRGRALVGVHWTSATVLLGGVLEHFASLNFEVEKASVLAALQAALAINFLGPSTTARARSNSF